MAAVGLHIGVGRRRRPLAPSGPTTDPGVNSINADGWSVEFASPPTFDPVGDPRIVALSRQGFDAAGNAATYADALILTERLRQPYPNQGSLSASTVALSDYVYATDTILGGQTNNSTEASPKPVAQWALRDRRVVGNSIRLELVAAHRDARNGEEVACVIFRATDGTTTVTQTVSASAILTGASDRNPVIGYGCDLDISTLANQANITVNAKVYPWIGGAAAVLDSADQSAGNRDFGPLTFRKDTGLFAAPPLAYVKTTGNDGTGVVSTTAATADASPFLTLHGALNGLKAQVAGGFVDGCEIRLGSGTFTISTAPGAGTYTQNAEVLVTRDPNVARANAILSFGAANIDLRQAWIRYRDISMIRGGAFGLRAGQRVTLEAVALDSTGQTGVIFQSAGACPYAAMLNCTVTGSAANVLNPSSTPIVLFRGNTTNTGTVDAWCLLGNKLTGFVAGFGNLSGAQSGGFIGFNKFVSAGATAVTLASSVDVAGFALIQNVIEYAGTTNTTMLRVSGDDPNNGDVAHFIAHHNSILGFDAYGRSNLFYNETDAGARTHRLNSLVGNIHVQINTKHDVFQADGTRVQGWSYLYGVGCRGEFSQFAAAGSYAAGFRQEFEGLNASLGASNAVRNDPLFVSYQGTTSGPTAGAGDGDYALQAGSPAAGRVAAGVLKWDLAGNGRSVSATASGAYRGDGE